MILNAPESLDVLKKYPEKVKIFLGGSIVNEPNNWQKRVIEKLQEELGERILILNPRRDDWDSSWKEIKEDKKFREQIEWELEAQEICDINVYYFHPDSKSPITLLELGLFIKKNPIVYCPKGFWKKGNVDIVCEKYNVPSYEDEYEWLEVIKNKIKEKLEI